MVAVYLLRPGQQIEEISNTDGCLTGRWRFIEADCVLPEMKLLSNSATINQRRQRFWRHVYPVRAYIPNARAEANICILNRRIPDEQIGIQCRCILAQMIALFIAVAASEGTKIQVVP